MPRMPEHESRLRRLERRIEELLDDSDDERWSLPKVRADVLSPGYDPVNRSVAQLPDVIVQGRS